MVKLKKEPSFSPDAQKLSTTSISSSTTKKPLFGGSIAQQDSDRRDNTLARDDVVYVKRDDRDAIKLKSTKDYNDFVNVMTTPTFPERFSYVDLSDLTNPHKVLTNSTSVANMLELIRSHLVRYDLVHILEEIPVLDTTTDPDDPKKWWDGKSTYNFFDGDSDFATIEDMHVTMIWERTYITDPQVCRELGWVNLFLMKCCSREGQDACLRSLVGARLEHHKNIDDLAFGGPLTLLVILQQVQSNSEAAIVRLGSVVKEIKISDIPGEDVNHLVNQLSTVLKRLQNTRLPVTMVDDLLKMFQTSSHPGFNDIFRTWHGVIIGGMFGIAPPTPLQILLRASQCYEKYREEWRADSTNTRELQGFRAQIPVPQDSSIPDKAKPALGSGGAVSQGTKLSAGSGGAVSQGTKLSAKGKKDPWILRPDLQLDSFVLIDGVKCWTKVIKLRDGREETAKFCGLCVNRRYPHLKGTWLVGKNAHFSLHHENPSLSANFCLPCESTESSSTDRPSTPVPTRRTFSEVLRGHRDAAENGDTRDTQS